MLETSQAADHRRVDQGRADVSIIIPAYNEASIIEDCIDGVLRQTTDLSMEILVVANGCSDDTAARARATAPRARARGARFAIFELARGSKPGALNFADTHATGRIRIYLDADIRLTPNAVEEICARLSDGVTLLCAPRLETAEPRSGVTRAYATAWSQLPLVRNEVVGCGLYAVNEIGRARWTLFPELISDDKFVRLHFAPSEQAIAERASYLVQMPEGWCELVRVRGRWSRGNRDLTRAFPELTRTERNRVLQAGRMLILTPRLWPSAPVFVLAFALGELSARYNGRKGLNVWERATQARVELATRRTGEPPHAARSVP